MSDAIELIDALVHLEDPRIANVGALLDRAATAGVHDVICGATDPRAAPFSITHAIVRVHAACGLHPRVVDPSRIDAQVDALAAQIDDARPIAIGECGLDARSEMPPLDDQARALAGVLEIARARDLPVIFHLVRATERFLDVLAPFDGVRGVVHGFTGAPEVARALVSRGLSLSFGGAVADPRARRARAAARVVPRDRLLIESDTPDHPVEGYEASEPAMLPVVVRALAALRGEDADAVARTTAENARALFALPASQTGSGR